jgi:integrase
MLKTKSGLPKHCTWNYDRHGEKRVRFLRGAVTGYPKGIPHSPEFMQEYAILLARTENPANIAVAGKRTKPGTVNALVASYYKSPEFRSLADSTKTHRRKIIDKFRSKYGDLPLKGLRRDHVADIMADKASQTGKKPTPEAANNLIKLLRVMLNYAVDLGMIDANPAVGIKRYKSRGDGFHTWTEDEIAQFEAAHAVGTKARLAHALLLYTGQRVSDVCRMGWQHVTGDMIKVKQRKTGTPLLIPLHPELKSMLATLPKTNMTFMITERGAPFTAKGLGDWFKEQCRRVAGLPHCSAHGLRKACATRLANAGCSVNQIAAITGHASLREIARYTQAADQERLARQALSMQIGSEGERDLSNLQPQIIQPRAKS